MQRGGPEQERHEGRATWLLLAAIIIAGTAIRLARLSSWWSIYNDYDEGAWAAGAKLISEGAVPYRDFLLVHPPLYEYVLGIVFSIAGFDLITGRHVAVFFSVLTIPLAWQVARRAFGRTAGLWAAFAFAFSPVLVFAGRRIVPDAFAILLAVAAVAVALAYVRHGGGRRALGLGALLGMMAMTKFTHVMTVVAILGATLAAIQPPSVWARLRPWVEARVLAATAILSLGAYVALFAAREALDLPVKVPLLDDFFFTIWDVVLLAALVILPYSVALLVTRREPGSREGWGVVVPWRDAGLVAAGGVAIGVVSLGPALVLAPGAFFEQTVLSQGNRPGVIAPSIVQLIRYFIGDFGKVSFYQAELLLVFPIAWVLIRRVPTREGMFLVVGSIVALLASQPLGSFPRYYISLYPFLMLMIGAVFSDVTLRRRPSDLRPFAAASIALGMVALSLHIPTAYWGYDIANTITDPREEALNEETLALLRALDPHRVAATSPTLLLLDPSMPAARTFDTFGYLWLVGDPPSALLDRTLAEGVDLMVITPWSHLWGGEYGEKSRAYNEEIRSRGTLVKVIGTDPIYHMEVYHMASGAGSSIFNPTLALISPSPRGETPLGWDRIEFNNTESSTHITRAVEEGREFTRFSVHQSGQRSGGDWAHIGAAQDIPFAGLAVEARVRTTAMTTEANETQIESGIQFRDEAGHWLVVGFGGGTGPQRFDRAADNWSLVVLPVVSGEWATHRFDVEALWSERGWGRPDRVTAEVFAAAHWRRPGDYSFDVELVAG